MTTSTQNEQEPGRTQLAAEKLKAKPQVSLGKKKKGRKLSKGNKQSKEARQGSKTEQVVDLLRRPGGASLVEIMTLTGWQSHSVRGFISGTLAKKMGLKVESSKREDGQRIYSLRK